MKKRWIAVAVALALVAVLGAAQAFAAEDTAQDAPPMGGPGFGRGGHMRELTDEQKAQQEAFAASLTEEQKALIEAMRPSQPEKPNEAEIEARRAEMEARHAEMEAKREAFLAMLNEEQKAAYLELHPARAERTPPNQES
jgi:Spy/CpxP family protein refolding chaperone